MWPAKSPDPFIPLLKENLGAQYELVQFNFRTALFGRYENLHVHWPEILVQSKSTRYNRPGRLVKTSSSTPPPSMGNAFGSLAATQLAKAGLHLAQLLNGIIWP
jgi:hypothetical protein